MGERMLRGSRLGAVSYESDRNTELAPRQTREYQCAKGHVFEVPFAVDAEVPTTWECKFDGSVARLLDGSEPEQKKAKPPRTHWDMLLERRTIAELDDILNERLAEVRARRGRLTVPEPTATTEPAAAQPAAAATQPAAGPARDGATGGDSGAGGDSATGTPADLNGAPEE